MKNETTVKQESDREVVVTRTFDAPARLVFEAWTRAELMKRWWVPKSLGMTLLSCEMDARVGGKYRLVFDRGESEPLAFFGTYVEVTPPSRLVWTNEEAGEAGQVTTVTFDEREGKTRVVMSERYPTKEAFEAAGGAGASAGTRESFEQLDELLAAGGGAADQKGPMTITITAFERSPDGGKGLARDTRVRWALEEVGQPYAVRLVSFAAMKEPAHLALHPFGQIPTYEEGDLALFETGAIVLYLAQRHVGLLPGDANARARATMWMFAALSTVEPPILELVTAKLLEGDKPWTEARLPIVVERTRARLRLLSARLGAADWLDGGFSAGDLMMVSVLLRLRMSGILAEFANLDAYVARGEARPAYQRAFKAQAAINNPTPAGG